MANCQRGIFDKLQASQAQAPLHKVSYLIFMATQMRKVWAAADAAASSQYIYIYIYTIFRARHMATTNIELHITPQLSQ